MSQVKLTADSGGGTVSLKAPATTTSNADLEFTVPDVATGATILTSESSLTSSKLTGALPAISGASLTGISSPLSFRNLVINGAMKIAQRGASDTSSAQGYTTVDRWQIGWGGADNIVETHQELLTSSDTGPWAKGFRNAYKLVNGNQSSGAGAGDSCVIQYRLEAHDVAGSGWDYTDPNSKITLSFWVKSSVAQAFQCYLRTFDGTDQVYSFSTGSLSANTWTKVTKTIPGNSNIQMDNNTGVGMNITLWQFAGADFTSSVTDESWRAYSGSSRMNANTSTWWTTDDATFHITGVQLEVGDTATEFEHRSYGDELARAQRYYYRLCDADYNGIGTGATYYSGVAFASVHFPVSMRAVPSLVSYAGSSGGYTYRVQINDSSVYHHTISLDTTFTSPRMAVIQCAASGQDSDANAVILATHAGSPTNVAFNAEL